MKPKWMLKTAGIVSAVAVSLAFTGCRDTDYDLGNVDKTIGIGGNFESPVNNSTVGICLDDVLDLGENNFLKVEEDGNYKIDVVDDNAFVAHMWVKEFSVPSKTYSGTYNIDLGDLVPNASPRRARGADDVVSFDAPMVNMDFIYEYNTDQITRLEYVGLDNAKLTIKLAFSEGVKKCLNNIQEVRFVFPQCVECGKVAYQGDSITLAEGNKLILHDVNPANDLTFVLHVKGIYLDHTYGDSYMTYTKGEGFKFHASLGIGGDVKVSDVNTGEIRNAGRLEVNGTATLSKMNVVAARGGFTPTRNFGKVGGVSLRNIPSFLTDDEVDLDLYNPQLNIDIESDVPFATKMKGAIVARDSKGNIIQRIDVPQFSYKANGKSVISVRRRSQKTGGDTTVVVVSSLSDIIRHMPDSIALVDLVGVGDDSQTVDIELGHNYAGRMVLSVASGIALAENAAVVYKDEFKGWNDKVKDVSFVETKSDGQKVIEGYIKAIANVENIIPAYLQLSAFGIDKNGNEIGADRLVVTVDDVIAPSKDGVTPETSVVNVMLQPKDNAVFQVLDGVGFRVKMMAKQSGKTAVTGVLLNAYRQTIKVTSLKLQKIGKIAVDLN